MSDFEVIDIGEHNRLKKELAECKKKLQEYQQRNTVLCGQLLDKSELYVSNISTETDGAFKKIASDTFPEQIPLGKAKHWGDE